jgi:hypothetical protein
MGHILASAARSLQIDWDYCDVIGVSARWKPGTGNRGKPGGNRGQPACYLTHFSPAHHPGASSEPAIPDRCWPGHSPAFGPIPRELPERRAGHGFVRGKSLCKEAATLARDLESFSYQMMSHAAKASASTQRVRRGKHKRYAPPVARD